MNATPFRTALRLFATIAIVAVLAPIGRIPSLELPIAAPQASAQPGAIVLAQGRCFNGRCIKR